MRILISYEESYHTYSDVLESAIGELRPEADVASCGLPRTVSRWRASTPTSWCRVARTLWIREGGWRGTSSPRAG